MTLLMDEKERIIRLVDKTLSEKFSNTLKFGPITIEEKFGHEGEPYLHVYIVFEGDQEHLDPAWTSGLIGKIRPELMEMGITEIPSKSFVEKSEWMALTR